MALSQMERLVLGIVTDLCRVATSPTLVRRSCSELPRAISAKASTSCFVFALDDKTIFKALGPIPSSTLGDRSKAFCFWVQPIMYQADLGEILSRSFTHVSK